MPLQLLRGRTRGDLRPHPPLRRSGRRRNGGGHDSVRSSASLRGLRFLHRLSNMWMANGCAAGETS
jgi:hypothetical protein